MSSHRLDQSTDLLIMPFNKGVALIKPEDNYAQSQLPSLADLLRMSCNIYFKNPDSELQKLNQRALETSGFQSINDAIGKSIKDFAREDTTETVLMHDQDVIQSKQMLIKDLCINRLDEEQVSLLTIKFPWYSLKNKIIGLLGVAIPIEKQNMSSTLAESLNTLANIGLLNQTENLLSYLPGFELEGQYITSREKEILHHLLLDKTAKQISQPLGISYRTVEFHINNLKIKLNVATKFQLIERVKHLLQLMN